MFSIDEQYSFSFPTDIRFGVGTRSLIPDALKAKGLRRPLVVTDKGLADHPMARSLSDALRNASLSPSLFADFSGNPVESHIANGALAFRSHEADSVVAIGGGAALDVAKAIALMGTHDGKIMDYCDGPSARQIVHPLPF